MLLFSILYRIKNIESSSNSLEKAMATHSSAPAWKVPWMEEPGRFQSMGSLRVGQTEWLHFHFSLSCIGEGNGNPLQCSCLENPRDTRAWWAAVYGVAQGRTWLKQLSSSSSFRDIEYLFHNILYYPFNFQRICSDIPSFICSINNFLSFFFFLY